jgi:hypothetical protein
MRKYCDCGKKISIEILMDLHVFNPVESGKEVFGEPSLSVNVCMDVCLVSS